MVEVKVRIAVISGYFDWFSGYQETALTAALGKLANTEVVASDRVNPIFTDAHLEQLGLPRRYRVGTTAEHGVTVTRLKSTEFRSMVWATGARRYINHRSYDLIVQVMPGQLFSAAAAMSRNPAPRVVLYGDNKAMWNSLPPWQRFAKGAIFAATKGVLYTAVNVGARAIYGYTPDTLRRLRAFSAGRPSAVMPLAFSPERFHLDADLRRGFREGMGLADDQVLLVAAGKIEPQKRLEWLISAFNSIAKQHCDVHLLVVGVDSSSCSREITKTIRNSPYRHRVHMRPFMDAAGLNAVFNGADLGVWPRNPAITIQQSMGTGLPVLLPRNDLVGHLIRPGSGHYFDLDETRGADCLTMGLAHALRHTQFSPAARRERVEANRWLAADEIAGNLLTAVKDTDDTT